MAAMNPNQPTRMKVGELAAATGLTVRTLHHYDELGLLRPSGRTAAGHRSYLPKDLERLQRIVSLRQLGLPLEEIGACLDRPGFEITAVLERQLDALDRHIDEQRRLRDRIAHLHRRLTENGDGAASVRELLQTIEETTMYEKHFSEQQLEWLEQRRQQVGEHRIRAVENEWPELIAAMRAEQLAGTDPGDARVQELAQRWRALVEEFTQGRADIAASVENVYRHEPEARQRTGLDPELMAYVQRAWQAGGS